MLIVIAPAKSLDYDSPLPTRKHSTPTMLDESKLLVELLAGKPPDELARLMRISAPLADLTSERFLDWETPFKPENSRPALLAFSGDVFAAMDAAGTFTERDYTHAQKVLRILSGLYGVLRPLDLIQAYRLEMGLALPNDRGPDLYSFWGDRICRAIATDLAASPGPRVLVNLASDEYFRTIHPEHIEAPIITPRFLVSKDGSEPTSNGFAIKRARGAMAGWIIRDRVRSIRGLRDFTQGGYRFNSERSAADSPVFVRRT
jgi:cytoplasmic iron level regulating protein YaaA (DUF328/UPF0246 family)